MPNPTTSIARGVNNDGTIIVGTIRRTHEVSIYWRDGSPPTTREMGFLPGGTASSVSAVNGDGRYAVRWKRNQSTDTFNIENLNVHPETPKNSWKEIAFGVNQDGTVIVGSCFYTISTPSPVTLSEAFIWREDATPRVQKLEDATAWLKNSEAYDVIKRDDGTIIAVGSSFIRNSGKIAVHWNNPPT